MYLGSMFEGVLVRVRVHVQFLIVISRVGRTQEPSCWKVFNGRAERVKSRVPVCSWSCPPVLSSGPVFSVKMALQCTHPATKQKHEPSETIYCAALVFSTLLGYVSTLTYLTRHVPDEQELAYINKCKLKK